MKPHRLITLLAVVVSLPIATACGPRPPSDPLQAQAWEHGIEILGVQLMADGDFARLNYRVIDHPKAKRSLSGEFRLLPETGDRALPVTSVGRLGPLRQRPSASGRPQFMLFTNGGALKKGDTAVLLIGAKGRISGIPVS